MSLKSSFITAFLLVCLQSCLPFESTRGLSVLAASSDNRALEEKQSSDVDKDQRPAMPSDSVNPRELVSDDAMFYEDENDVNDGGVEKRRLRENKRRLRGSKRGEQKRRLRFHGDDDFYRTGLGNERFEEKRRLRVHSGDNFGSEPQKEKRRLRLHGDGNFGSEQHEEKRRLRFHGDDNFGNERHEEKRRLRFHGDGNFGNERHEEKRRLRLHGEKRSHRFHGFDGEMYAGGMRDPRLGYHHLGKREASSAQTETLKRENVDTQSDFLRNKRSVNIEELAGALKSKRHLSISNDMAVLAGIVGEIEREKMRERNELRKKLKELGKRASKTMTEGILDDSKQDYISLLAGALRDQK